MQLTCPTKAISTVNDQQLWHLFAYGIRKSRFESVTIY